MAEQTRRTDRTSPSLHNLLTGEGTEQSPYLIHNAQELNLLSLFPCDWDKHFRLMADIDLDPNLPGGKVFDRAVIAADTDPVRSDFQGTAFTGVLDGNGHMISHLTIVGGSDLGLFGCLSGEIKNLGAVDVNITGSEGPVGGIVGSTSGSMTNCYSTGVVRGGSCVGGLVGSNGSYSYSVRSGSVTQCYSTAAVSGWDWVGGLVGWNWSVP